MSWGAEWTKLEHMQVAKCQLHLLWLLYTSARWEKGEQEEGQGEPKCEALKGGAVNCEVRCTMWIDLKVKNCIIGIDPIWQWGESCRLMMKVVDPPESRMCGPNIQSLKCAPLGATCQKGRLGLEPSGASVATAELSWAWLIQIETSQVKPFPKELAWAQLSWLKPILKPNKEWQLYMVYLYIVRGC